MKTKILALSVLATLLASCGSDEPTPRVDDDDVVQVKSEENRTVLIGASDGKVYNMQGGAVYATLPGCTAITNMTMHGEDYYASGTTDNGTLTYWSNGRAVPLSGSGSTVDIVRVHDEIYALGSDGTLYANGTASTSLTQGDPAAIVRNSRGYGVACNTSDGIVWKIGSTSSTTSQANAHATSADLVSTAAATTFNLAGYTQQVAGGQQTYTPCLWLNGSANAMTLDINHSEREQNNHTYSSGQVMDVAHNGQTIIAVGNRSGGNTQVATVWLTSASDDVDDAKTYWQADGNVTASAVRVLVYGGDIYVMTVEHNLDTDAWCTRIWMNHQLKGTVGGIVGRGFVVI